MAYDEKLAARILEGFSGKKVKSKPMMGGWVVMLNDKMCAGIFQNQLMVRINPERREELLQKKGAELMEMSGRQMKGYIIVSNDAIKSKKEFDFWINEALAFNKLAKSSKKK
ncbi:MAG: TfoX/Sxy family protein [Bacteroidota bacterium]